MIENIISTTYHCYLWAACIHFKAYTLYLAFLELLVSLTYKVSQNLFLRDGNDLAGSLLKVYPNHLNILESSKILS